MSRRSLFAAGLALTLTLGAACDAPSATRPEFGYDPTSLTGGVLYRWPAGSVVRIWVEPDSSSGISLLVAVARAVETWNAIPEFAEFKLERSASIFDANIVVYDRAVPNPMRGGTCLFDARGAGYTYFCLPPGNPRTAEQLTTRSGAATTVTVIISMDRARVTTQAAYDALVSHEMGHAIGIGGHSDQATDLMFGNPTVDFPSNRDRLTLQYLLGQRPNALLR
jgi:hypothetical protein